LGIFGNKGISFAKIKLSKSKINSDKNTTITINVKNGKEKFDNIVVTTKTDDLEGQYLKIDKPLINLPPLDFPNKNTGDHQITITPYNTPLVKMTFKITVQVFAGNKEKPLLKKEFSLLVRKK
jgi:ribosomal protein L9